MIVESSSPLDEKQSVAAFMFLKGIEAITKKIRRDCAGFRPGEVISFPVTRSLAPDITKWFSSFSVEVWISDEKMDGGEVGPASDAGYEWIDNSDMRASGIDAPDMIDGILLKMWVAPSLEKESIEMVLIHELNHLWTTYERFKKLEAKDDQTKQLAMLMRMNGSVDNQMTTRLLKAAQPGTAFKTLLTLVYRLWNPEERHAFTAEALSWFKDSVDWSVKRSNSELQDLIHESPTWKFIKETKDLIESDFANVSESDFKKVKVLCFRDKKLKAMPIDKFIKLFKERTRELITDYEKRVWKVVALGRDLSEHWEIRNNKKIRFQDFRRV